MGEKAKPDDEKNDGIHKSCMVVPSSMSGISTELNPIAVPRRRSGPTRRSTKGLWTAEEDARLTEAVRNHNAKNWKTIAKSVPNHTDTQCMHRWQKVLDPELVKGNWTKEEDDHVIEQVEKHGSIKWAFIAGFLKGRTGKQCRERWHNHLNPAIIKGPWTVEEEVILIDTHGKMPNKWAKIAKCLPGRSENSIKNHWNCSLKKRLVTCCASGHPHGIASVDWKNHAGQTNCPKADPAKESIDKAIPPDQKLTVNGHYMTSNMSSVQSASPESLNLELRLNLQGDSKCLGVGEQPSSIKDPEDMREEMKPIPIAESKCTTLEVHYHKPFNKEILEAGFGGSWLKFKEATFSSRVASVRNNTDRVEDDIQVPATPSDYADGKSGPFCTPSLPLMDKEGSIPSKSLSISEGYTQKIHHPTHCSAPPNIASRLANSLPCPIANLRNLAKSFPTPSIIRKRKHESSAPLLAEKSQKETADANDCAGSNA